MDDEPGNWMGIPADEPEAPPMDKNAARFSKTRIDSLTLESVLELLGGERDHPLIKLERAYTTAMEDPFDRDSQIMRKAAEAGRKLRALAEKKNIALDGWEWVAPRRLNPHAGRLRKLFNSIGLSDTYLAWQKERTEELVDLICKHDHFQTALGGWHALTDDRKKHYAAIISELQQSIFCRGQVRKHLVNIELYEEARQFKGAHSRLVLGTYRRPSSTGRRAHLVSLNTHRDTRFHVAAQAMNVIHHENDHATQWTLAEAFALGSMPDNHPLAREARLFLMAFNERNSYVPALRDAYRAHPLELDTFGQSEKFVAVLRKGMAAHGVDIDFNAYPEKEAEADNIPVLPPYQWHPF